ncbi:MAG: diaminopropionate ammonia-lyase [Pseudomonadota bacterium]
MTIYQHERTAFAGQERRFRTSADRPLSLLTHCPAHQTTDLVARSDLANELGIAKLFIKDESKRMGLGSFKALGGAFAVAQHLHEQSGSFELVSPEAKAQVARETFITASAGNHGLSVAAGANVFGAQSVIVLSRTVPESFADRIRALNAKVEWVDGDYEASVEHARSLAKKNGWYLLADGSWEGYVAPPARVMEGYTVLAQECANTFRESGEWPTHVFLQAGVGGLAASIAGHIRDHWDEQPQILVVEPDRAPCLQTSIAAGQMKTAPGEVSNMGRLDCKDASLIAFEALQRDADQFQTISDDEALAATARLSEAGFASTPSGVAGYAGLMAIDRHPDMRAMIIVSEGK